MIPVLRFARTWMLAGLLLGCDSGGSNTGTSLEKELEKLDSPTVATAAKQSPAEAAPIEIQRFCGDCHALPEPSSFVREVWYDEIHKGFEFYARSGRDDLQPPSLASVLKY